MAIHDYDSDALLKRLKLRNHQGRKLVFLLTIFVVVLLPMSFGMVVGNVLEFNGSGFLFGSWGLAAGVFVLMKLLPRFLVTAPQTTAFVTTNQFTVLEESDDPNIPYGPGTHISFPWELRAESGNITLDVMTIDFTEVVPTATSAVIVDATVQFKFDLEYITQVIRIGARNVEKGFVSELRQWFSTRLAKENAEEAKNSIHQVQKSIEDHFMNEHFEGNLVKELLLRYGLRVTGINISGIDFTKAVQKARDSQEEMSAVIHSVCSILGYTTPDKLEVAVEAGKVTQDHLGRALERALVASGNASLDIKRYDITGLSDLGPLGSAVGAALTGISDKSRGGGK